MFILDETRWGSQAKLNMAGFLCVECRTWKAASEFLNCKCDIDSQFLIAGKENGMPVWWQNEKGWIEDITEATTFSKGILGESLPHGAEGILELTLTGEHVTFYSTLPRGGS